MAETAEKIEIKESALKKAVRECLRKAKNDSQRAAVLLEERVRKSSSLKREFLDPLITAACHEAVNSEIRVQRRGIWLSNVASDIRKIDYGAQANRVVLLAKSNILMMFPLPGGKPLGEATGDEVDEAIGFYERQADNMSFKVRWLKLVRPRIPAGKKVRDGLTNERLAELQTEASK